MAATTRAEVVTMAPELAQYPDGSDWTQALADAALFYLGGADGPARYGDYYEYAHRLATAHLVTLRKQNDDLDLQSESIGGIVSRSWAVTSATQIPDDLDQTRYGQQLRGFYRSFGAGGLVT